MDLKFFLRVSDPTVALKYTFFFFFNKYVLNSVKSLHKKLEDYQKDNKKEEFDINKLEDKTDLWKEIRVNFKDVYYKLYPEALERQKENENMLSKRFVGRFSLKQDNNFLVY